MLCGGCKWVSRFEAPCVCTRWTGERWWNRCPGCMAGRAKDSVAPLRRGSAGWMPARIGRLSACVGRRYPVQFVRRRWWRGRWGGCQHCGTRQECSALRLNARGLGTLFVKLLLQHPNRSQQAASGVRCVLSGACEVTHVVGDAWATCPNLFRVIWARSRRAGFF